MRVVDDRVHRRLGRELLVEVARVDGARDGRLKRRLDLLGDEPLPVDVPSEKRMVLDVERTVDAQPLGRVPIEEPDEERAGLGANLLREAERVLQNLAVHLVRVLVIKGRETGELFQAIKSMSGEAHAKKR